MYRAGNARWSETPLGTQYRIRNALVLELFISNGHVASVLFGLYFPNKPGDMLILIFKSILCAAQVKNNIERNHGETDHEAES